MKIFSKYYYIILYKYLISLVAMAVLGEMNKKLFGIYTKCKNSLLCIQYYEKIFLRDIILRENIS